MVIPEDFNLFYELANKKRAENKKFLNSLKKRKGKIVDEVFHALDDEVFAKTNCLDCANCCKTTGPLFTQKDIERISKHLKLKPGQFVTSYLRIDEDGDYVLQQVPCTFLGADNYCSIYEVRPKACSEYPHTHQSNIQKMLKITSKNIEICPAVFEIVEKAKKEF